VVIPALRRAYDQARGSKGFRLSLVGAAIFFAGLFGLLVMPIGLPLAAVLFGGLLVWGGFMWTIFGPGYAAPPEA
jgi:hypothetical protein